MADNNHADGYYTPESKCRWSSYRNYRIMIWAWMMNDITLMFSPAEVSHNSFYLHATVQALALIFIGIPLVYSEVSVAQYTNCNILSMWNFFPLFRFVGIGTLFLVFVKTIYVLVLTSWYLEYTFHSACDPPPWFTCDEFNDPKCMVKRINVSMFQHCLEAQIMFNDDCGMKTASHFFFDREIGSYNTQSRPCCSFPWKEIIASTIISSLMFVLTIKQEKFIQTIIKIFVVYLTFVILIMFCVALSTSGSWYASFVVIDWLSISINSCYNPLIRGCMSLGTGYGILIFLSNDVPFRSPALMTSISTSLFSLLVTLMLTLILFGGIKTVSFFHGEEENIIEIGDSIFFIIFASVSEILTYFDGVGLWSFTWFSAIFFGLFVNLWILHYFLVDMVLQIRIAQKYKKTSCGILITSISLICWAFFFCDLTGSLVDATEIMQLTNSFLFSLALFWFYGYRKHNIDILFMTGIKASYFWKICWLFNPLLVLSCLVIKWYDLDAPDSNDSYFVESIEMSLDILVFYAIVGIYYFILFFGMLIQIAFHCKKRRFKGLFVPNEFWGPRDEILFKSRKMFVPEIMTTEFLYRQVRIRGYYGKKTALKQQVDTESQESTYEGGEWSPLTSN